MSAGDDGLRELVPVRNALQPLRFRPPADGSGIDVNGADQWQRADVAAQIAMSIIGAPVLFTHVSGNSQSGVEGTTSEKVKMERSSSRALPVHHRSRRGARARTM